MNNKEGMSPTNCIPLTEEAARQRKAEEEDRLHATSTTIKDYKAKKENIPKLQFILETLIKMIKNCSFFLTMLFALACMFVQLIIDLECEMLRDYEQRVMRNEEAILRMYFAILKESHLFFMQPF